MILQKFKQKENKFGQDIAAEYFGLLNDKEKVKPENWFLFGESYESLFISEVGSTNFGYLMAHYTEFIKHNAKEVVDGKIYNAYKKLAEKCLLGNYFKNHPYSRTEFEVFKTQVDQSRFKDKSQLNVLIAVAMAGGEKDVKKAGKLIADHVGSFTQKNMSIVFNYYTLCSLSDRTFPYMKEISDVILTKSKNEYLIDFCEKYSKKLTSSTSIINE
ncbi:hypothetical protein [Pedobacter sp. P26]|uniref:hypothetical protein n=1 Tax=Pedobacter sp. P26 TaxID=3423956 RepID=UPI003D68006E